MGAASPGFLGVALDNAECCRLRQRMQHSALSNAKDTTSEKFHPTDIAGDVAHA